MSVVLESPRGACVLGGVMNVISAIEGACPIFHSGPGCCMQTSGGEYNDELICGVATPSTNMMERDVVFGGEKKLRSTIQGAIDIYEADAFFVLTGCTAVADPNYTQIDQETAKEIDGHGWHTDRCRCASGTVKQQRKT